MRAMILPALGAPLRPATVVGRAALVLSEPRRGARAQRVPMNVFACAISGRAVSALLASPTSFS
jgi:hypothetical protein